VSDTHRYACRLSWTGSTAAGYDAYDRSHTVDLGTSGGALTVSADPAFRGSPDLTNPEQLLLAAASSCQMLSYLAVAARQRFDVVAYEDDAEAVMPEDDRPVRITQITLRPRITVAVGTDLERARRAVEIAHRACYIANTVSAEITIDADITEAG
jgi:organic hydroperoxide reductase OsmC/OhrA